VAARHTPEMSEPTPPSFRKTRNGKWAVMAPIETLETALKEGGEVKVLKKNGDWSTFTVASLGKPFDVDGTQMCYGYGPEEDDAASGGGSAQPASPSSRQSQPSGLPRQAATPPPPPRDEAEPLPTYSGHGDDEWDEGF
jgi:hypothetical protein